MSNASRVRAKWRRWRRGVYVAATHNNGWGVFAAKHYAEGDVVLLFTGPKRNRNQLQDAFEYTHALQIGLDEYLGPSGGEDDFVNHSCNPNTRLQGKQRLVALRDIQPGEEITVDYATLTVEHDWRMLCRCGAPNCREVITDYFQTPSHLHKEAHFQTWPAGLRMTNVLKIRS